MFTEDLREARNIAADAAFDSYDFEGRLEGDDGAGWIFSAEDNSLSRPVFLRPDDGFESELGYFRVDFDHNSDIILATYAKLGDEIVGQPVTIMGFGR